MLINGLALKKNVDVFQATFKTQSTDENYNVKIKVSLAVQSKVIQNWFR